MIQLTDPTARASLESYFGLLELPNVTHHSGWPNPDAA